MARCVPAYPARIDGLRACSADLSLPALHLCPPALYLQVDEPMAYEKVVLYNYSKEELAALVDMISYIKVRQHTHHLAVERCTEDCHVAISPAMLRSSNYDLVHQGACSAAAAHGDGARADHQEADSLGGATRRAGT